MNEANVLHPLYVRHVLRNLNKRRLTDAIRILRAVPDDERLVNRFVLGEGKHVRACPVAHLAHAAGMSWLNIGRCDKQSMRATVARSYATTEKFIHSIQSVADRCGWDAVIDMLQIIREAAP